MFFEFFSTLLLWTFAKKCVCVISQTIAVMDLKKYHFIFTTFLVGTVGSAISARWIMLLISYVILSNYPFTPSQYLTGLR
jgi:hypothetical protein